MVIGKRFIAALMIISMMVVGLVALPTTEAEAHTTQETHKYAAIFLLFDAADLYVTEDNIAPGSKTNCANDLGDLNYYQKTRICKMKEMNVWGGSSFRPWSHITRGKFVAYLYRLQKWLNNNKASRVTNLTTSTGSGPSDMGWCSEWWNNCGIAPDQTQANGAAFIARHNIGAGVNANGTTNFSWTVDVPGQVFQSWRDQWIVKAD